MNIIARVNKHDEPENIYIYFGYEISNTPYEDWSWRFPVCEDATKYIGIISEASDDSIFAVSENVDNIYKKVFDRWGKWDTFELLY